MKIPNILSAFVFTISLLQAHAQPEISKGFKKGIIVLADSTVLAGYIKESIHSNASVTLVHEPGGKKKTYQGYELISAEIDGSRFLCLKGDFFRIISYGKISFLLKESDASGIPSYNGTEAIFTNGTEGGRGDHFIYQNESRELKLVTKKTFDTVVASSFGNCDSAVAKAKSLNHDIARLKEAVDIYNNKNDN